MKKSITPMIHVPDVGATVKWYEGMGFEVTGLHCEEELVSWARVSLNETSVMFNEGGQPSSALRREVDLYIQTEGIDELFESLPGDIEVVEPPHNTDYGMREFIIRDLNRFWLTFGEPMPAKN